MDTPASNKEAALSFLRLTAAGSIPEAYDTYVAPDMRHHNAYFKGDRESLRTAMEESQRENPNKVFEVKSVLAEGDRVAVFSHVQLNEEQDMAVVHILRFKDGKIIEMWDVGMPIPEHSPNENGVF